MLIFRSSLIASCQIRFLKILACISAQVPCMYILEYEKLGSYSNLSCLLKVFQHDSVVNTHVEMSRLTVANVFSFSG